MKHPFHSSILPYFTMGAGGLGLTFRLWLYSAADKNGLLPAGHFANAGLYILTALTLLVLFLATRELQPRHISKRFYRASRCCAYAAGGLGLILTSVLKLFPSNARLASIAIIASLIGGILMLLLAGLAVLHKKPPYWVYGILTVVFMLNTIAQCQAWGAEPQLQEYFFPLLASVFLILSGYQKTALAAKQGNPRKLALFSQCALFFCCLSLNSSLWPLYLGLMFWSAVQIYFCIRFKKEA